MEQPFQEGQPAVPGEGQTPDPGLTGALQEAGILPESGAPGVQTPEGVPAPASTGTVKVGDREVPLDEVEKAFNFYEQQDKFNRTNTQEAQRLADERRALEAQMAELRPIQEFAGAMNQDPDFRNRVLEFAHQYYGQAQPGYTPPGQPAVPPGQPAQPATSQGGLDPQVARYIQHLEGQMQGLQQQMDDSYSQQTWGGVAQEYGMNPTETETVRQLYDRMMEQPELIAKAAVLLHREPTMKQQAQVEAKQSLESHRGRIQQSQVEPGAGGSNTPGARPLDLTRMTPEQALQIAESAGRRTLPGS